MAPTPTEDSLVRLPLKDAGELASISVVVVPDFRKDGIVPESSQNWVESMLQPEGTQAQVFRFKYQIASNTNHSVWRQLRTKGEDLLRLLISGREADTCQLREKPLIWVGHGLGGLIVKRSLAILSNPAMHDPLYRQHNKDFLDMTAGIIFFGTPNTKAKQPKEWNKLTNLLKFAGKFPKPFLALSETDAETAAKTCDDFAEAGLEATVLSIYETKDTRLKSSKWLLKDSVILVDRVFAETLAKKETLLANNVSHGEVAVFHPNDSIHQHIGLLLRSALSMRKHPGTATDVPDIQGMRINPNTSPNNQLWEDSVSQVSNDHKYWSDEAMLGSSLPSNFDVLPLNDMGEYVDDAFESREWPCHLWDGSEGQQQRDVFFGREDTFRAIDDCFFRNRPPPSAAASEDADDPFLDAKIEQPPCLWISGLGGMGKTQTATQYAMARRQRFDAIFVMQADNSAKLSEYFSKIAPALGLSDGVDSGANDEDLVVSRNKALKWLSCPKFSADALERRTRVLRDKAKLDPNWLLIFDNVEDSSILTSYWPVGNVGCILVTTRDARASNLQGPVTHLELDKLDTASASDLFLQLSRADPTEVNKQDACEIVDKLGGLPLAIEHVAAYVYNKCLSPRHFLNLYYKTLLGRRKSNVGNLNSGSWSYDIIASWALEKLDLEAKALLRVYSFLNPDGAQDSLLTDSLTSSSPVTTPPEDYPDDELNYVDARATLLKSSLIRVDMSKSPAEIRMHRLVQDIAVAEMTSSQRCQVFTFVAAIIHQAWPFTDQSWDHQDGLWATQERLLQHIFRLVQIENAYHIVSDLQISLKRKFVELLSTGGWYRQERGDFDSGIPLFELGIKLCDESPNDFLDLRADIAFGMGGAMCDTNRWSEFFRHAQDQLHYRLRSDLATGVTSPTSKTAIAYSELGLAQALMGQYEEGVQSCDKSIELYATQPDVVDGSFFPAFPHLHRALALVGAGRPEDGERGLLDLIAWHETEFDPSHIEFKLGYAWHCCGLIYSRTDRPQESIKAYNNALFHYGKTVGETYHRTGNVCGKIAEYHVSLSQHEAADFYFEEALKAYKSQPHYKPELARHYFLQSQALHDRGDEEPAKDAMQKSRQLFTEVVTSPSSPLPEAPPPSTPLSLELLNKIVAPWVW